MAPPRRDGGRGVAGIRAEGGDVEKTRGSGRSVVDDQARRGEDEIEVRGRDLARVPDEHAPVRGVVGRGIDAQLGEQGAHRGADGVGLAGEQERVAGEALCRPVDQRPHQIAEQRALCRRTQPDGGERDPGAQAVAREIALAASTARHNLGRRAQARVTVAHGDGEILKTRRLGLAEAEAGAKGALRFDGSAEGGLDRAGRREATARGDGVAPRRRRAEQGDEAGALSRPQLRDAAQAEAGVEHAARAAGEAGAAGQGERSARAAPASEESGAIGLDLQRPLAEQRVEHPRPRLGGAARPAGGEQQLVARLVLGLHEELGEGGMGGVRRGVVQDHLGPGGELDASRARGVVAQRQRAQLDVAVGGDAGLEQRRDLASAARDRCAAVPVGDVVAIGRIRHGLLSDGPERAVVEVAQVEEDPLAVLRPVAVPGRQQAPGVRGVTTSRSGEEHGVGAVGEQAPVWGRIVESTQGPIFARLVRGHSPFAGEGEGRDPTPPDSPPPPARY